MDERTLKRRRADLERQRAHRERWERASALAQERMDNERVSAERNRPRVLVGDQDITEDVVTVLDALHSSLDWGSGFLDEQQVDAWDRLAGILNFDARSLYERTQEILNEEIRGQDLEPDLTQDPRADP